MTPAELTCRDMAEFLGDYVGGELAPAVRAVFEDHLAECPDCVTYLRTYEATIRLAGTAADAETSPRAVPEALVRAILAARPDRHRPS